MATRSGSRRAVYAALGGNLLIAAMKFAAAGFSGSSAMLSEGVHSLIDTINEVLLLYGLRRASLPPDTASPLGHGRELYFWSFIVALLIFSLGAGVSAYEGVMQVLRPEPIDNFRLAYIVLGIAAIFEGGSWWVAMKEFSANKGQLGYIEAARKTKDPTLLAVLFEDSAALLGLAIAFIGIGSAWYWRLPQLDGLSSIGIGLILAMAAAFLARETKALLIGEPASENLEAGVLKIASEDPVVDRANGLLTVHLGPDQIVAALSAQFQEGKTAGDIQECVERIEERVKLEYPQVTTLFVKPQTWRKWRDRRNFLKGNQTSRRLRCKK